MTIKTAKQIKDEYLMSSVDSEQPQYVSLQEYEALRQSAGVMSQDKERDIIKRDERIFELQTKIEALSHHVFNCGCVVSTDDFGTSMSWCDMHFDRRGLQKKNEEIRYILQQWVDKADDGLIDDTFNGVRSPELEQLIAATKAALEE